MAIMPMGRGMVCHTLHEPRDLYDAGDLFDGIEDVKPDPDMVKLATQLIERQDGKFAPDDTEDRYEARLRDVIDAKLRGEGIEPEAEEEPDRGNVIDLMAALKASLGRGEEAAPKSRAKPQATKAAPAAKSAAKPKAAAKGRAAHRSRGPNGSA